MLKWNENEVADYLGAQPSVMDDGFSHHFEVRRDNLVLCFSVFQHNADVQLELFRGGDSQPIVAISALGCRRIRCETRDLERMVEVEYVPDCEHGGGTVPKTIRIFTQPFLRVCV
jgi:hypothetical protein